MFQEKRPTCVSVIGWVWIILGGLMCLSAVMALLSSAVIGDMAQDDPNMPFIFKIFPLVASVQVIVAVLGLISGINFLKLKAWSRRILEILTWIIMLFVIGFGGFTFFHVNSISSSQPSFGFGIMEMVFMTIIIGIYGVPLGIMLKYLRGEKVKSAMIGTDEQ